ncbi:hypothetical protein B005_5530 [Nocardiopsis alba ATCC BAA-2165]|uniref:Uncharacterized protein n=1 Tax=Nocardiopsis alba (strain ATCC BAA-2165 / BE74) TaxID=1205910 RepID=J7LHR5_NOCAA|nr:hypothetical protein B005_5530 [Nocardiopsis alba ATCC BAA-2165]
MQAVKLSYDHVSRGALDWFSLFMLIFWIFALVFAIWEYATYGRGSSDD